MIPREVVGPREKYERIGARRLRDTRPFSTRLWTELMGQFSGPVLAGAALAMFVEPALVHLTVPAAACYAGLVVTRRVILPMAAAAKRRNEGLELSRSGEAPPAADGVRHDLSRPRPGGQGIMDFS